jgi:hypothetical protein
MIRLGLQRLAVPALALAIIAAASVGTTYAATKSHGDKACETTKGYLVLASSKGKCPKHSSKVSLGKTGPMGAKGATGPSADYVNADDSGSYTGSVTDTIPVFSSLPTGSYVITATFQALNETADPLFGGCQIFVHTKGSQQLAYLDVPPQVTEDNFPFGGEASSSIVVAATINDVTGHDLNLNCGDTGLTYTWSVSAQLVGSLTATGNSGF